MNTKRVMGLCCLCLTTVGAILKPASTDGMPFPDDRPKFYAVKVLDHINVSSPDNILGEEDGRFAEIRPGGEITVLLEKRLFASDASDDGRIVTKDDAQYALAGLFRFGGDREFAWQSLQPGRSPGGFKFGMLLSSPAQTTDTIRILNDDTRSVYIDAVIGYKSEDRDKRRVCGPYQ